MPNEKPIETDARGVEPAPRVRVRTMATDLADVSRGGGSADAGEGVSVSVPGMSESAQAARRISRASPLGPGFAILAGVGAFIVVLAAFGYLAYRIFSGTLGAGAVPQSTEPATPPVPIVIPARPAALIVHESAFRVPAEIVEIPILTGSARSVSDLRTFAQNIVSAIESAGSRASFFELAPRGSTGAVLSATAFFSAVRVDIVEKDFLEKNFKADFTAFVYKDGGKLSPGIVLTLKDGLTATLLQNVVRDTIEQGRFDVDNLFVSVPGARDGSFKDKVVGSKPVRYATFTLEENTRTNAEFFYGWFNATTMVLATSEAALAKAFEHVGR